MSNKNKKPVFKCLVKNPTEKPLSLRKFHERRNKVLVMRKVGGLGDIIMHRMIFSAFHKAMPEIELTFACPAKYADIINDHPLIHHVIDSATPHDKSNYGVRYDTTTRCRVFEANTAPNCTVHRSDIWANSCGLHIDNHDMHLSVRPTLRPNTVLFVPSTDSGHEKNLTPNQTREIIIGLQKRGYTVIGLFQQDQPIFRELGCETIPTSDLYAWASIIAGVDAVITIDTAAFHMAGGLKKPMVGIFGLTDGKIYGKYFKFALVQKHRDEDKNWYGPCFKWVDCPKSARGQVKPCISELTSAEILEAFDLISGKRRTLEVLATPPEKE